MKILIVAPFFPFPLISGGHTRLYNLIKQLSTRHEIDIISPLSGKDRSLAEELAPFCRNLLYLDGDLEGSRLSAVRRRAQRQLRRIGYLAKGIPPEVSGFFFPEIREKLEQILRTNHYDIVQVELARMALNFPGNFFRENNVRKILVDYDLTFIPHLRHYQCEKGILPRLWCWLDYRMHRSFALKTWRLFDCLVAMSDVDGEKARQFDPELFVQVVPNGVDTDYYRPRTDEPPGRNLLFLGGSVHYANVDALTFFLQDIYPVIKGQIANISLTVIGDGWDRLSDRFPKDPSVSFTGFVEDIRTHAALSLALIAPIRIGGGTRLKILEAMAMGLPVITSQIGCEGIPVVDGEHALIAHTAADYADQVNRLVADSPLREAISKNARSLVERDFSWQSLAIRMDEVYERR